MERKKFQVLTSRIITTIILINIGVNAINSTVGSISQPFIIAMKFPGKTPCEWIWDKGHHI